MPDCYRVGFVDADGIVHPPASATHELDRGDRGEPLPLCTPCADALADHDGDAANDLVSPIEGAP